MNRLFCFFLLFILISCNENKRSETNKKNHTKKTESKEPVFTGKLVDYHPCSFKITLPSDFQLVKMYEDDSPDYCDYEVKTDIEGLRFEIHSMLKSRFSITELNELYEEGLKNVKFEVQGSNKFEDGYYISGQKNDNHIYYLRKIGENFISDFYLEYPKESEKYAEMLIVVLYSNFESD